MKKLLARTLPLAALAAFAGLSAVQTPSALSGQVGKTLGTNSLTLAGPLGTQTLTLNTGLAGQVGTTPIPFTKEDDNWRLTADDINQAGLPRPAVVAIFPTVSYGGWPPPLANSQWISPEFNRYASVLQPPRRTSFTYSARFNLPACFTPPTLTMELRADDVIRRVVLNNIEVFREMNPMATSTTVTSGSHARPPLRITHTSNADFKPTNQLDVVVEDTEAGWTGLNVVASVTYEELGSCPEPGRGGRAPRR